MTANGIVRQALGRLIVKKLTTKPPYGVKVTATIKSTTPWWTTDPEGPAFEAARAALKAGFGKETAMVGAGGTIGFVQPFADLLEGAPCILMGVADPNTQAHSRTRACTWATG
jgi:acetylornithine deacetylase/succinyl-diaminopimelate desuccinylase-like protein